jgi:hypothetical protein
MQQALNVCRDLSAVMDDAAEDAWHLIFSGETPLWQAYRSRQANRLLS